MGTPFPSKWRHFEGAMILFCVRWYRRYILSYRDMEELMQERGPAVDHTTILWWFQRYPPELEQRCRPRLKATNVSYRYFLQHNLHGSAGHGTGSRETAGIDQRVQGYAAGDIYHPFRADQTPRAKVSCTADLFA
jgi:hypothetical protein